VSIAAYPSQQESEAFAAALWQGLSAEPTTTARLIEDTGYYPDWSWSRCYQMTVRRLRTWAIEGSVRGRKVGKYWHWRLSERLWTGGH
jgi:hypothetical protein